MAGGGQEAIGKIKAGDEIRAADPHTGKIFRRAVKAVLIHHDTELADLSVRDQFGHTSVLHTTQDHPFFDRTTRAWTPVDQLGLGDSLQSPAGQNATVDKVEKFVASADMYNLTVAINHTYYVVAGSVAVLVHNSSCDHIALGLQEAEDNPYALDEFGMETGGKTYSEWPANVPWHKQLNGFLSSSSKLVSPSI